MIAAFSREDLDGPGGSSKKPQITQMTADRHLESAVIPTERVARERRDPHRESESLPGGDLSTSGFAGLRRDKRASEALGRDDRSLARRAGINPAPTTSLRFLVGHASRVPGGLAVLPFALSPFRPFTSRDRDRDR
jgi:hypothetical protein